VGTLIHAFAEVVVGSFEVVLFVLVVFAVLVA
jgi:hypothetical protein